MKMFRRTLCDKYKSQSLKESTCSVLFSNLRLVFDKAVEAVSPYSLVNNNMKVQGSKLVVGRGPSAKVYSLNNNVHVVAFGKAVPGMIRAAEDLLGSHVQSGIASIPKNYMKTFSELIKSDLLPREGSRVAMYEGSPNNLPDDAAHQTSLRILRLAQNLQKEDILLTLISGGGSALLPTPKPPITIAELRSFCKLLSERGATINELNTVRKQLEILKGGGLSLTAAPAQVIALILSDVIGDPLEIIASGPTVANHSAPQLCRQLFDKLGVSEQVPPSVQAVLNESSGPHSHTKSSSLDAFSRTQNLVVGNNFLATSAAAEKARELGFLPVVLSNSVSDEAKLVGQRYSSVAVSICSAMFSAINKVSHKVDLHDIELVNMGVPSEKLELLRSVIDSAFKTNKPVCIICGGETTVRVGGSGVGGRNQEMALACSLDLDATFRQDPELANRFTVVFLSAGTDGIDGPCDAAGAIVSPETVRQASAQGLDAKAYLENNDSYSFFKALSGGRNHIVTGHTGTNVMDIQVLVIQPLSHYASSL